MQFRSVVGCSTDLLFLCYHFTYGRAIAGNSDHSFNENEIQVALKVHSRLANGAIDILLIT